MALTIMPEDEMDKFKSTLKWINEENHEDNSVDLKSLFALMSIAPGPKPYAFTSCMLFKRKETPKDKVPYMLFTLTYGNFAFQIYLPLSVEDEIHNGSDIKMDYLPTSMDMMIGTNSLARKKLDFNSKLLVKNEEVTVVMQYETMTVEMDVKEESL